MHEMPGYPTQLPHRTTPQQQAGGPAACKGGKRPALQRDAPRPSGGQPCTVRPRRSSKQVLRMQQQATHKHRIYIHPGGQRQSRQAVPAASLPQGSASKNVPAVSAVGAEAFDAPCPRPMPTPTRKQHTHTYPPRNAAQRRRRITGPHTAKRAAMGLEKHKPATCRSPQRKANPQAARQARTTGSAAVPPSNTNNTTAAHTYTKATLGGVPPASRCCAPGAQERQCTPPCRHTACQLVMASADDKCCRFL